MVFADRASYLKEFLVDRVAGRAHDCWYYRDFEGLALLPLSSAIRTALLKDPVVGEQALMRMSLSARNSIVNSLTEHDAHSVLRAILPEVASDPSQALLAAALNFIHGVTSVDLLSGYLSVRTAFPEEAPSAVLAAIRSITEFVRAVERPATRSVAIAAIQRRDLAALVEIAGIDGGQALLRLCEIPIDDLMRVVGQAAEVSQEAHRSTPFGGAFLLLESLAELPINEMTKGWPAAGEVSAAQAVRWVLLLQVLGTDRSYAASLDPVLCELFEIPRGVELGRWSRKLRASMFIGLQSVLEDWQNARGDLSGRRIFASGVWVDDGRGLYVAGPGESEGDVDEETKARLKYIPRDRSYLRPDPRTGVGRRLADALAPSALAVIRGFSHRLPGFARSHLEYLSRNFLSCSAEVAIVDACLRATLSRPPLDLVLRMTRVVRSDVMISWTVPPHISLFL
jgi:hypothetical protein